MDDKSVGDKNEELSEISEINFKSRKLDNNSSKASNDIIWKFMDNESNLDES
jgi:hypothetical protein